MSAAGGSDRDAAAERPEQAPSRPDPAPLARPTAVVRDRRDVADRGDREADALQRPQCRFRPEPGPRTSTSMASCAHGLASGVLGGHLRRERRRFARPLEALAAGRGPGIALPWASVMVIMVLLNVAATRATPEEMFLRSRRRRRGAVSLAMSYFFTFFLPAIGAADPCGYGRWYGYAGRAPAVLAMAQAAIAAEIHQALDVHRDVAPQVALDPVLAVDRRADARPRHRTAR